MYTFLNRNNFIYNLHFGFRQQYSTSHALINVTENIRRALDDENIGCGAFVDLWKAFDIVDHQILSVKLHHNEICEFKIIGSNPVSLIGIHKWYDSCLAATSYGVSQRSDLGPLLFLLYINDLMKQQNFEKFTTSLMTQIY